MTLSELEAAIGWLERNRLCEHLNLLEGDLAMPGRSASVANGNRRSAGKRRRGGNARMAEGRTRASPIAFWTARTVSVTSPANKSVSRYGFSRPLDVRLG